MDYPKLTDKQDLRRKLMDTDIAALQAAYTRDYPFEVSYRQWAIGQARSLDIHFATVYYYTNDSYRAKMMAKNVKAHSKANDPVDYAKHRATEIRSRAARRKRNPALVAWGNEGRRLLDRKIAAKRKLQLG